MTEGVAVADGDPVDVGDGDPLGDPDGDPDGEPDGDPVGEADGDALGETVGETVGLADGESAGIDAGVSNVDTGVPSRAAFMNAVQMRVGNEPPVTEFIPPTPERVIGFPLASSLTNMTAAARSGV